MNDQIPKYVFILGVMNIVVGSLHLLIVILALVSLNLSQEVSDYPTMVWTLLTVFGIFSVPYILVGIGLLRRVPVSRPIALVLDGLLFVEFPLGTPLAIYAVWVLLVQDTSAYFGKSGPDLKIYSESE
jgi:hypothetical protein